MHLSDAHYITDGSKFISVVLLALRAMMQLEMPHINVLSKIDLLSTYGQLRELRYPRRGVSHSQADGTAFDLKYYTEARELGYLLNSLEAGPRSKKMEKLNRAMVELVAEYSMVGFETLAVEVSFQDCSSDARRNKLTRSGQTIHAATPSPNR